MVEVVKVRRRVEGVEELVKSRRVSMMYELGCDSVTVAVAKLSLCSIGRGVSEYGRSVRVNKLVFGGPNRSKRGPTSRHPDYLLLYPKSLGLEFGRLQMWGKALPNCQWLRRRERVGRRKWLLRCLDVRGRTKPLRLGPT